MASNKTKEGCKIYQKASELSPKNVDVLFKYGLSLKITGNRNLAVEYFEKVIKLEPKSKQAGLAKEFLQEMNVLTTKPEEKTPEPKAKLEPIKTETYQELVDKGLKYFNNKEYQKAEKTFKKAIKLNPDNKEAYFNLGEALKSQGKNDEAQVAFQSYLNKVSRKR